MARIDPALLAGRLSDVAVRANGVRHDPAVQTAAQRTGDDMARAGRALGALAHEAAAAWRRSQNGSTSGTVVRP